MVTRVRSPITGQVHPQKTAALIAAKIRRQIVRRELLPGMTLPTEPDLLAELGVSRPTLREAFRILETESLISVRRGVGGGALVLTPAIAGGARYVGLLLQFDGATIAAVYEAPVAREPICARMMAAPPQAPDLPGPNHC